MNVSKFNYFASWLLLGCVIVSTAVLIRREIFIDEPSLEEIAINWGADYVEGWEEALAIGLRAGPAGAPVQVVEFSDYQCPYCAHFGETVQEVRNRFPNNVSFTFAPFPLAYHPQAKSAERAAECAHEQRRLEPMRSVIYASQSILNTEPWAELADQAGVEDAERFGNCMVELDQSNRIDRSVLLADRLGIQGTPTIFVNGWKWPIPPTIEHFDSIVENVANGEPPAAGIDFLANAVQE